MELTVQITSLIQNVVLIVTGIIGSILYTRAMNEMWEKNFNVFKGVISH